MAIGTFCRKRNKQDGILRQIYKAPVIPFHWDHHPGAINMLQDLIKSPDQPKALTGPHRKPRNFSVLLLLKLLNQSLTDSAAECRNAPSPHAHLQQGPAVGSRDKAGQEGGRVLLSHPVRVALVPPQVCEQLQTKEHWMSFGASPTQTVTTNLDLPRITCAEECVCLHIWNRFILQTQRIPSPASQQHSPYQCRAVSPCQSLA